MTEPKAAGFQFECNLCGAECFGVPKVIDRRHRYVVDEECAAESVVPQILTALANEYSHPPLWGKVVIEYKRFLDLLPEDFERRYKKKRAEYRTPLARRIYCRNILRREIDGLEEQCGTFVGANLRTSAGGRADNEKWLKCSSCSAECCESCGGIAVLEGRGKTARHLCATPQNDDASAFDGLVQGVHYQICPGCGMKVELAEACNALRCLGHACRASFCAICGLRAYHDSGHWQTGKPCPRWNQPTDRNAGFDRLPEVTEPPPSAEWLAAQRLITTEMDNWRERKWNERYMHDEKHTIWWLNIANLTAERATVVRHPAELQEFNLELQALLEARFEETSIPEEGVKPARAKVEERRKILADEANLTLFRHLLLLQEEALQVLPLHRGVGRRMTKDHMGRLQINYICKHFGILVLSEAIDKSFMLNYPRLVDMFQRTVDELEWLMIDLQDGLEEPTAWAEAIDSEPRTQTNIQVPEDQAKLCADSYAVYKALEAKRLAMIELETARPPWLGAAIDMFWLQYRNLRFPTWFRNAGSMSEKCGLMMHFVAHDQEIKLRRNEIAMDNWSPEEFKEPNAELWEATISGYTEFAAQFRKLVPQAVLMDFLRGWRE